MHAHHNQDSQSWTLLLSYYHRPIHPFLLDEKSKTADSSDRLCGSLCRVATAGGDQINAIRPVTPQTIFFEHLAIEVAVAKWRPSWNFRPVIPITSRVCQCQHLMAKETRRAGFQLISPWVDENLNLAKLRLGLIVRPLVASQD